MNEIAAFIQLLFMIEGIHDTTVLGVKIRNRRQPCSPMLYSTATQCIKLDRNRCQSIGGGGL
jgi:hypothetical protein